MNPMQAFEAWAPAESRWSSWVKPVLFGSAHGVSPSERNVPEAAWAPSPAEGVAIVVDMPGEASLDEGLALAARGYRPIPLYNAVYHPAGVVPLHDLVAALIGMADKVQSFNLQADAPPAFLLDSRRLDGERDLAPGKFDNRWLVLPQDFPSANLLLSQKLRRVILLQPEGDPVRDDLAHVLLRWQRAGIRVERQSFPGPQPLQPITIRRPWGFKWFWYRFLVMLGRRRNSAGGFGSLIPEVVVSAG